MIIDRPTPATQNGLENVIRGWPKWMFCKAFKKHKLCSSWSIVIILTSYYHHIIILLLVVIPIYYLVGGLEHLDYFSIQLGMSSSQLLLTPSLFRGVGTPPTRWGCSVSSHVSLHDSFASLTVGPVCNLSLLSPESTTFVAILPSGFFVYITMERSTMLFMGKSTISSQFTMGFPIVFPWFSYGFPMVSPFWWNPSFSMVNCCGKSQSPFHTTVVFFRRWVTAYAEAPTESGGIVLDNELWRGSSVELFLHFDRSFIESGAPKIDS